MALLAAREPDQLRRGGAVPDAIHSPRAMLEFWDESADPANADDGGDLA